MSGHERPQRAAHVVALADAVAHDGRERVVARGLLLHQKVAAVTGRLPPRHDGVPDRATDLDKFGPHQRLHGECRRQSHAAGGREQGAASRRGQPPDSLRRHRRGRLVEPHPVADSRRASLAAVGDRLERRSAAGGDPGAGVLQPAPGGRSLEAPLVEQAGAAAGRIAELEGECPGHGGVDLASFRASPLVAAGEPQREPRQLVRSLSARPDEVGMDRRRLPIRIGDRELRRGRRLVEHHERRLAYGQRRACPGRQRAGGIPRSLRERHAVVPGRLKIPGVGKDANGRSRRIARDGRAVRTRQHDVGVAAARRRHAVAHLQAEHAPRDERARLRRVEGRPGATLHGRPERHALRRRKYVAHAVVQHPVHVAA